VADSSGDDAGQDLAGEPGAEQLAQVDVDAQAAALEVAQRGQVQVKGGEVFGETPQPTLASVNRLRPMRKSRL
jgi:hypothetical protein